MVATPSPTNAADARPGPLAERGRHRLEYRVERFPFGDTPSLPAHLEELLERLNELGRQGWLAVSVDLTDTAVQHSGVCHCLEPRLAVLLHREVED